MKGPKIKNGIVTTKLICKKVDCEKKDCIYHHETLTNYDIPHTVAHLEENPLYCPKGNWHRNQYQRKEIKNGNENE